MSAPLRTSVRVIRDAAVARGIPVLAIEPGDMRITIGTGAWQRVMWLNSTSTMSHHGARIAGDKAVTKQALARVGVPVSIGYPVDSLADAITVARILGYPVVLKPRKGNKGHLVFVELNDDDALRGAWQRITAGHPRGGVLIEEYLPGEEYRVLTIDGRVVAVNHRMPPDVIGDGISTIQQLVDRENARPERGQPHMGFPLLHIRVDEETHELLARSDRTLDSVLPKDERQFIRRSSNASGGGSTAEVTALMHPVNVMLCELAARTVGLDIAGVDFIAPDIGRSVLETGGGIIEINSGPGLIDHLHPGSGSPCDAGGLIVDMLYPPGSRTRAPLVAVVEAAPDAPLARGIAEAVQAGGMETGLLVDGRVTVRGVELSPADDSGGIRALLSNPLVEVAIVHLHPSTPVTVPYSDFGVIASPSPSRHCLDSLPTPESGWVVAEPAIPVTGIEGRQLTYRAAEIPQAITTDLLTMLTA